MDDAWGTLSFWLAVWFWHWHLSPIIVVGGGPPQLIRVTERGVRVTLPPAQRGGKVWSWKDIGSVFFSTRPWANAGENKFWLAGLVSLKIFKTGFFRPSW